MNDMELLNQHISDLQRRLDRLEDQVHADAVAQAEKRALVDQLTRRLAALPLELQQARGAAENGALKMAELARLLDQARAEANAHRSRAYALESEEAELPDQIARARLSLESANHGAVRERDALRAELAKAVTRKGQMIAADQQAEDERLQAVLGG